MNATEERWLPVVGWEHRYEVSNLGRVRTIPHTICGRYWPQIMLRQMSPPTGKGYKLVGLSGNGPRVSKGVHILVLTAFVGPRPKGHHCCHYDGDPANSRLENLRWDTPSSNALDRIRHGRNQFANQTHCKHGHELTVENTYLRREGWRQCRQCIRDGKTRNYKRSPRGYGKTRTHCKHGHEFTPENTYTKPSGARQCKACRRETDRRRTPRKK